MARASIAVLLCLILGGCATSKAIPGRSAEYSISCWYFTWYVCYDKAKELCPDYKVVSENEACSGRELRVACPVAK